MRSELRGFLVEEEISGFRVEEFKGLGLRFRV